VFRTCSERLLNLTKLVDFCGPVSVDAKLMKSGNDKIREIGKRKGDLWDRFDRLQRNTLAFSRGKGKRRTVQLFRSYQDLADGRDH
jgi:hypothetical protein